MSDENLPAHLRNEEVFDEAVALYARLAPATLAERSVRLLNPPTLRDRLSIASAVRHLGGSPLFWLIPTGISVARLYYLVSLLEGVVMPQLRMLVDLSEQSGVGTRLEWTSARRNLSPALSFLSGNGAAVLAGSPNVLQELRWLTTDRVPQLRNAVAHFSFRLDEAVVRFDQIQSSSSSAVVKIGPRLLTGLAQALHLPDFDPNRIPQFENSVVQYEENANKPLTSKSRKRTYVEIGDIVRRVEKFAFTLLFAALEAAKRQQHAGAIGLEPCGVCGASMCSGAVGATVTCRECGAGVRISPWQPRGR